MISRDPGFIVFALPRSRTAWLSRFLSYGEWHCGHDELRRMRTLDDVKAWFSQPFTGTVETAGAPWWRLLPRYAPGARIVVVRRSVEDVADSLLRIDGVGFDRERLERSMRKLDRKLDQLTARVPGVLSVDYADLENEETCSKVFAHCLGFKPPNGHWAAWSPVNVQVDFRALVRYADAYGPAMERLANSAKQQILAEMSARKPKDVEGVEFQTESFDAWVEGAAHLFKEHCVTVGETPDQWKTKNIPLMRLLDQSGALQITTARSNGRMFGYLMTIISPSLVYPGCLSGTNTTFFASPEFPGLGMKIQRASLQSLKKRGITEVFYEAGARGSGPRLGTMYRRLGAVEHGQVFRLELERA